MKCMVELHRALLSSKVCNLKPCESVKGASQVPQSLGQDDLFRFPVFVVQSCVCHVSLKFLAPLLGLPRWHLAYKALACE